MLHYITRRIILGSDSTHIESHWSVVMTSLDIITEYLVYMLYAQK